MLILSTNEGALWVGVPGAPGGPKEDSVQFVLPVFSNHDDAFAFLDDIKHGDEIVKVQHIDTKERIVALAELIEEESIAVVMLNPPNPKSMSPDVELIFWYDYEFSHVLITLLELIRDHGIERALGVLDQYIKARIKDAKSLLPSS